MRSLRLDFAVREGRGPDWNLKRKRDSLKGRKRTRRWPTFNDWLIDNFGTPSYDQRRGRDNPWVQSTVGWRL